MENLTLKQKIAIYDEMVNKLNGDIMEEYYQEYKDSPTLKDELIKLMFDTFRTDEKEVLKFLNKKKRFEIEIIGRGNVKEIIEALKLLALHIENTDETIELVGMQSNNGALVCKKFNPVDVDNLLITK